MSALPSNASIVRVFAGILKTKTALRNVLDISAGANVAVENPMGGLRRIC